MAAIRKRSRKDVAIASSLAIAVSLVSGAMIAHAQSFQVSGSSIPAGSATVIPGTNTTDIQVFSNNAVINWTPSDTAIGGGPIIFQTANTTATFTGAAGFTVLNRIVPTDPTRAIEFDGSVLGRNAAGNPDGTVFFYSPGGIILGSGSSFDVGNLGLTTSDVTYGATGAFGGANGTVVFQPATQPTAAIQIAAGAQINALNAGSYVALVAPSVANGGVINVNGSAALVAAEGATINFSPDGLFNIQVDVGSDAGPDALTNTGVITGPAGTGLTQSHRIYLVAVPKNTAIGMAITQGSQLGFDVAGAADTDGNAVILSAGGDVVGGNALTTSAAGSTQPASITIDDGGGAIDFTSRLTATGTSFGLTSTGTTSFASNLDATGADSASLLAASGGAVSIAGNLSLNTNSLAGTLGGPNDGGLATLEAQSGGSIDIIGNAVVSAYAAADRNGDGSITGGTALAGATGTGSSLTVNGALTVDASALDKALAGLPVTGGSGSVQAVSGGSLGVTGLTTVNANATAVSSQASVGGQAQAIVQDGGSLSLSNLDLTAVAASNLSSISGATGGGATGGTASIVAQGTAGTVTISGTANLTAAATGGAGSCVSCSVDGGFATGGTASIVSSAAAHVLTIGSINLDASSYGGSGSGGDGGAATGGTAAIDLGTGASLANQSGAGLNASATGGSTGTFTGGAAVGGNVFTRTAKGSNLKLYGYLYFNAAGYGGGSFISGNGGNGTGGSAKILVPDGTTTLAADLNGGGNISLDAEGYGGSGFIGGKGLGGTTAILLTGPGVFSAAPGTFGSLSLNSDGSAGQSYTAGGAAGDAQGGNATVSATGGGSISITGPLYQYASTIGSTDVSIDGVGSANGTGGSALLSQDTGGSVSINGSAYLEANGGGSDNSGGGAQIAGTGTGGSAAITVNDPGGITITGSGVSVVAEGYGGFGASFLSTANGGAGIGGTAKLTATNGTLQINAPLTLSSTGYGGAVYGTGNGGTGTGGSAQVSAASGSIVLTNGYYLAEANGVGGDGDSGGSATGGLAGFIASGTGTLDATAGSAGTISATATATGGAANTVGGRSGDAQGGIAQVLTSGSAAMNLTGPLTLDSSALQAVAIQQTGTAIDGGDSFGGTSMLSQSGSGLLTVTGDVLLKALGTGADNSGGGDLIAGNGTGGTTMISSSGGGGLTVNATTISLLSDGSGGNGTSTTGSSSGGMGLGGTASVEASGASSTLNGALNLSANGSGGSATYVGSGGTGIGGQGSVIALSSLSGASALNVGTLGVTANGSGGAGGAGLAAGDVGGSGGSGLGGSVSVLGSAGNGSLVVADLTASANGTGGAGGTGYAGVGGPAGNGGLGGDGTGGSVQAGTQSGIATPDNTGSAAFTSIQLDANGIGGSGGSGGAATGGDGGTARGGGAMLLVSGSPVTVTAGVTMHADGTGGAAGGGAPGGTVGGASVGVTSGSVALAGARLVVTDRALQPAQRGTLTVGGAITGTATATDGAGLPSSATMLGNDPIDVTIANSDVNVSGGLNFTALASQAISGASPALIDVSGSTANFGPGFAFTTPGDLTLGLDSATLTADSIDIAASNWILGAAPTASGTLVANSSLALQTAQDLVTYAGLQTSFAVPLSIPGAVQLGNVTTGGSALSVQSATSTVTLGNVTASDVSVQAPLAVSLGGIGATGFVAIASGTSLGFGAITAGRYVDLASGSAITATGNIQAGADVNIDATGAISLGNVSAGIVNPSTTSGDTYTIGILSQSGSVSTGSLTALQDVGVAAPQSIKTGSVSGVDMQFLGGTGVTLGPLTASGRALIADYSMLALGQTAGGYNKEPAFAAAPVAMSGAIAITGTSVVGGFFHAATQSNLSADGLTAASIAANAGGTISVGGPWLSPLITLVSNDLDILGQSAVTGLTGGLNAGTTGQISLESTNPAGMFIGDGLTPGSGYAISNAEWSRINSGSVSVYADNLGQTATTMTIGDLTITGPQSGSTIDDPNGSVLFATGLGGATSGTIRIVGNLVAKGFLSTNTLGFDTGMFELDTSTGSIKVNDASGNLSGILQVSADYIHIAQGSILDKLRADPFYAGRFADLNNPAAVQRPGGVFNALALQLYPGQTLYIQNTGSFAIPAGFLTGYSVSDVNVPTVPPAGGISVIINGAFVTPTGLVTGAAAFNMLVNDPKANFTGIAGDSTLNGCALSTSVCATDLVITPTPGEFKTLSKDPLGEEPMPKQDSGNSQGQKDEGSASAAISQAAIAPPAPLINTRPLSPPTNITEPLTGGGNPALMGGGNASGQGMQQ